MQNQTIQMFGHEINWILGACGAPFVEFLMIMHPVQSESVEQVMPLGAQAYHNVFKPLAIEMLGCSPSQASHQWSLHTPGTPDFLAAQTPTAICNATTFGE